MLLVVYYSLSGKTTALAGQIAGETGADLIRIEDVKPRRGFFGFMRSGFEAVAGKKPEIRLSPDTLTAESLAACDAVILLSPVWAGHISSPMRSFLSRYGTSFTKYSIYLDCGDQKNKYETAIDDARKLCGSARCVSSGTFYSDGAGFPGEAAAEILAAIRG